MTVIAIGGAEDKTGDCTVLRRVLAEAGAVEGQAPRVLVITTATGYPEEVGEKYTATFQRIGVTSRVRHVTTRAGAADAALLADVAAADVIFFTGGDQMKLATVFNGTPFMDALRQRETDGAVIAGTSAGAAVMSSLMIYGGDPEKAMEKGEVLLTAGLGLAPNVVFDTHFLNRNRLARLFNVLATAPDKTGIGLDEDTGVILRGKTLEVIGSGKVTVVDAKAAQSNITTIERGDVFTLTGATVHTLKHGDKFRL
ncbi:MAG: cyanophycinase [Micavibrio sp.]|nr:cyanophycinase [Micavibrio sp.]